MTTHTISLAPKATCHFDAKEGTPHDCGMTFPIKPETPQWDTWLDDHGSAIEVFVNYLVDSGTLPPRYKDEDRVHKLICAYLELDPATVKAQGRALTEALPGSIKYAAAHGIPWMAAMYLPSKCPNTKCGAEWPKHFRQSDESCEECLWRFDLLRNKAYPAPCHIGICTNDATVPQQYGTWICEDHAEMVNKFREESETP